jgi:hypothetical protein
MGLPDQVFQHSLPKSSTIGSNVGKNLLATPPRNCRLSTKIRKMASGRSEEIHKIDRIMGFWTISDLAVQSREPL